MEKLCTEISEALCTYRKLLELEFKTIDEIARLNQIDNDIRKKFVDILEKMGDITNMIKCVGIDLQENEYEECVRQVTQFQTQCRNMLSLKQVVLLDRRDEVRNDLAKYDKLKGLIRPTVPNRICSICFTREVDVYVSPCGHTFCTDCSQQAHNHCFICKGLISSTHKLFYN